MITRFLDQAVAQQQRHAARLRAIPTAEITADPENGSGCRVRGGSENLSDVQPCRRFYREDHVEASRPCPVPCRLALTGAGLVAGCDLRPNTLEDGLSQPDAISEVRITGGSGNVTIVGDGTTGVEVRRIARYRSAKPGQSMTVAGGTLNLDTDCGVDCSASYEVRVEPRRAGHR